MTKTEIAALAETAELETNSKREPGCPPLVPLERGPRGSDPVTSVPAKHDGDGAPPTVGAPFDGQFPPLERHNDQEAP